MKSIKGKLPLAMVISALCFGSSPEVHANVGGGTVTIVNEQVAGPYYSGDVLIQGDDGTADLVPFIVTATGAYQFQIDAGSASVPYTSWQFEMSGQGAGGGNPPGGGGGGPPQVILGGGTNVGANLLTGC